MVLKHSKPPKQIIVINTYCIILRIVLVFSMPHGMDFEVLEYGSIPTNNRHPRFRILS